jgi:hypothetical protein
MRSLLILPVSLLAACGGGGGSEEKKAEETVAASMEAGQWETAFEVRSIRSTDKTTPAIKAAAGDREAGSTCIPAGSEGTPPPALFAGPGYECATQNSYIRNGRINASLKCSRGGVRGDIMMTVQGSYTGTSFEGTVDTITYLPGAGDFEMSRKMTGRKTAAACAAEGPETGKSATKAG